MLVPFSSALGAMDQQIPLGLWGRVLIPVNPTYVEHQLALLQPIFQGMTRWNSFRSPKCTPTVTARNSKVRMRSNDWSSYAQARPTAKGSAKHRPMKLARNFPSESLILPMKRMQIPTLNVKTVMSTTTVLNTASMSFAAATMWARNSAA